MSCSSSDYQGASGILFFVAGLIGAQIGGPLGQAFANFLARQNSILAQFTGLFNK